MKFATFHTEIFDKICSKIITNKSCQNYVPNPGLFFVYFRPFLITISTIQSEKTADGVLGIQTRGNRMVDADKTTELWRPPNHIFYLRIRMVLRKRSLDVCLVLRAVHHLHCAP